MIKATPPIKNTITWQLAVAYATAGLLLVMVVLQLANFEGFVKDITSYGLTPQLGSTVLAIGLIALEIFALPFLLRLWLSRAAQFASALFVVLLPLKWFALLWLAQGRGVIVASTGMLGDIVPVPLGGMSLVLILLLLTGCITSFVVLRGGQALKLR